MVEHGLHTETYNGLAYPVQGHNGFHSTGGYARSRDSTNAENTGAGNPPVGGAGLAERRDLNGDRPAAQMPAQSAAAVLHNGRPSFAPSQLPGYDWAHDGVSGHSSGRIAASPNVLLTEEVCPAAICEATAPNKSGRSCLSRMIVFTRSGHQRWHCAGFSRD
jgi:hypothetical protein